jgi:hypothetical protein
MIEPRNAGLCTLTHNITLDRHQPITIGCIDRSKGSERKEGQSGADHDHGDPPNIGCPWIGHPIGPIIPRGLRQSGCAPCPPCLEP